MVSNLNNFCKLCVYTHSLGISGKSQVLFALVFTTRYLDLVFNFISIYNTVMKIIFLVTAYGTLYLMFIKFKATYDSNHDTFRAEFLVIPAVGLALLVNHEFSVLEVRRERKSSWFGDPLPIMLRAGYFTHLIPLDHC